MAGNKRENGWNKMNSAIKIILKSIAIFSIIIFFTQCSSSLQNSKIPVDKVTWDNELGDSIHTYIKEMPKFPGGDRALYESIAREVNYPLYAKRQDIEGKIYTQFVVTKEGNIADVVVAKGIERGCDQEAIRVIKSLPRWIPGKINGIPVNVRVQIPIVFKLQ
jgi:TonB family protein